MLQVYDCVITLNSSQWIDSGHIYLDFALMMRFHTRIKTIIIFFGRSFVDFLIVYDGKIIVDSCAFLSW